MGTILNGDFVNTQIVGEIRKEVEKRGDAYSSWYAGVTKDYPTRVFKQHKVDKAGDNYIIIEAKTSQDAHDAEQELHRKGFEGYRGGDEPTHVYAYLITDETDQDV